MSLASLASRLRHEYIEHPTKAALRSYLLVQARRGKFDRRMFSYYGVDPNVNPGCEAAAVRAYAAGLVPTSTTGGQHAAGSYHKQRDRRGRGLAVDFGLPRSLVGTSKGRARLEKFQRQEHWRQRDGRGRIGGHDLVELIGPNNSWVVLRDRETDLAEGTPLEQQHDNHVHEAYLS